jgi:hypothetical protein
LIYFHELDSFLFLKCHCASFPLDRVTGREVLQAGCGSGTTALYNRVNMTSSLVTFVDSNGFALKRLAVGAVVQDMVCFGALVQPQAIVALGSKLGVRNELQLLSLTTGLLSPLLGGTTYSSGGHLCFSSNEETAYDVDAALSHLVTFDLRAKTTATIPLSPAQWGVLDLDCTSKTGIIAIVTTPGGVALVTIDHATGAMTPASEILVKTGPK